MRKRVVSVVIVCSGVLLITAALFLLSYNLWDDYRADSSVKSLLDQMNIPTVDEEDVDLTPDYVLDPNMDMPTSEIDGYLYIGRVSIPAIGIELPIMDSWSYPQMKIAPCRYTGSVYLDNLVICGHNYTTHLGRISNLQPGDSVVFTDMAGNVFEYEVALIETIDGTAVEEMQSGDWDFTLFTCTMNGQARVTVRCNTVSIEDEN